MQFRSYATRTLTLLLTLGMLLAGMTPLVAVKAADHRDSFAVDALPEGDFSDVFAWVDPADNNNVILAFAVNTFLNPNLNPTYRFAEEYLYQMKIDNGGSPAEDLVMQVKFDGGRSRQGYTVTLGTPEVVGPRGNKHLTDGTTLCTGNRDAYVNDAPAPDRADYGAVYLGSAGQTGLRDNFIIQGSGPRGSAINGVKCWAGVADDSFQTDVSQIIFRIGLNPDPAETSNFGNHTQDVQRGFVSTSLGPLRGRPLRPDATSGVDGFGGYNASHVVVSIPRHLLTNNGEGIVDISDPERDRNPNLIGVWGTVSRPESESFDGFNTTHGETYAQFERMGQEVAATVWAFARTPLGDSTIRSSEVNAAVGSTLIPGPDRALTTAEIKDLHNTTGPETDAALFRRLTPTSLVSGGGLLASLQNTIEGRKTLLTAAGFISPGISGVPYMLDEVSHSAIKTNQNREFQKDITWPDYMRLNVAQPTDGVRPGAAASGNNSQTLGLGKYGYQNGRRPADDVVDIYLRFAREMTDVQFGPTITPLLGGNPLPGYEPYGANPARRPLDCTNLGLNLSNSQILVPCRDARIFNVLQGTDFIERNPLDIMNLANQVSDERALSSTFPYFGHANPMTGETGSSEFPAQK